MLTAKSDSLKAEFARVSKMIMAINDMKHLEGLEGIKSQKNLQEI
jgi:hypothetical protein